jgi:phenazine biosynthesis-like protein
VISDKTGTSEYRSWSLRIIKKNKMSGTYEFVQLDVFTRTPLTGNPLAIFTDARRLTDQQMQALAREVNLSETTFVLPRRATS